MILGRREAIVGIGGLGLAASVFGMTGPADTPVTPEPLKVHAARRGLNFGAMIRTAYLQEPALVKLLLDEADMTVAEVEMKWGAIERTRGNPYYGEADQIARFCKKNSLRLRGHAGFWYRNIPQWADLAMKGPDWRKVLLARVSSMIGHYRGRVSEWDVVNEAIDATDSSFFPRQAPFGRPMDFGYIADAFHAAREADPSTLLFYNDFGMEYDTPLEDQRRAGLLALLDELRRRNAPIQGFGLQAHLGVHRNFNAKKLRAFLGEVAARGVIIRLTEFDVMDRYAAAPPGARDQAVADHARRFLDAAFDEPQVKGLVCWGIRDRDSWVLQEKWTRGLLERPLPWDDQLRRKPLWTAIAAAFDAAPERQPG